MIYPVAVVRSNSNFSRQLDIVIQKLIVSSFKIFEFILHFSSRYESWSISTMQCKAKTDYTRDYWVAERSSWSFFCSSSLLLLFSAFLLALDSLILFFLNISSSTFYSCLASLFLTTSVRPIFLWTKAWREVETVCWTPAIACKISMDSNSWTGAAEEVDTSWC